MDICSLTNTFEKNGDYQYFSNKNNNSSNTYFAHDEFSEENKTWISSKKSY